MNKSLISILASLALTANVFATGNEGINPPQSGVINFTAATSLVVSNTFPFSYSSLPAVIVSSANGTNNAPYAVSQITLTGFTLTCNNGATTNGSAAWQSYAAYPRQFFGTNAMGAATLATNTFASPFIYPPNVTLGNTITNGQAAATTITTTNFVITVSAAETVNWSVIGLNVLPGINQVTY